MAQSLHACLVLCSKEYVTTGWCYCQAAVQCSAHTCLMDAGTAAGEGETAEGANERAHYGAGRCGGAQRLSDAPAAGIHGYEAPLA